MRSACLVLFFLGSAAGSTHAQSKTETGISSQNLYGKTCYTTSGVARPTPTNRRLINHVVHVNNQCFKPLKLRICYYKTDHCVELTVLARSSREAWLGAMPAMDFFRYDVTELR